MYIPILSRNDFILIPIVHIPDEPFRIVMSDTQEFSHTRCHISINELAHTSCQSRCSYAVLLTQAAK
ncbi:hypothetical protein F383_30559 [Gossypium arboreum]|uniref:Uncharacterized protein n=1 Tax=Gossypium arboreum TaxID=29729 RepID=A0A0B0N0I4_GOSAR|nr:hypothetical protein F383_30559 [Gossypium arboreum]